MVIEELYMSHFVGICSKYAQQKLEQKYRRITSLCRNIRNYSRSLRTRLNGHGHIGLFECLKN